MGTQNKVVSGRTIMQYAKKVGASVAQVKRWLADGRLNAMNYMSPEPYGRGGHEPLLTLIYDTDRPERLVPLRKTIR